MNLKLKNITDFIGITNSRVDASIKIDIPAPETLPEKKMLLEWEIVPKVEKKALNKRLIRTFTIIGIVVALILVIMKEIFIILFAASIVFFLQVVSKAQFDKVKIEVSNHGIFYDTKIYYWNQLKDFFFVKNGDGELLAVSTRLALPSRLLINFYPQDREKLKSILTGYIQYLEQEPKTFLDKAYDKIADKFDFEEK